MLTRQQKHEQSEQLRSALDEVKTLFLLDNKGLTVNEITVLRSAVRRTDATYKVVKNSVVKLALAGTRLEELTPALVGPKALAFTAGDGVALAKVLKEFINTHPALSFQKAYLDGQVLDADAAVKIAELPSKEQLIASLLNLLQSPIRRLVVALSSPLRGLASVLDQVARQREIES